MLRRTGFKRKSYNEILEAKKSKRSSTTSKPKKMQIRPISRLKKDLWAECRRIIRAKYGNICYTCNKGDLAGGNWQTGHFITSSTCSTPMRYSLDNLRPQCYHCNINLSGNWVVYENKLKLEKGEDFVEKLKLQNRDEKGGDYKSFWYIQKIEEYKLL